MEVADNSMRGVQIGQKHYEGYCIELMEAIATQLQLKYNFEFKYEFELVPDGKHGNYDAKSKSWNGLMKRLLDHVSILRLQKLYLNKDLF